MPLAQKGPLITLTEIIRDYERALREVDCGVAAIRRALEHCTCNPIRIAPPRYHFAECPIGLGKLH